MQRLRKPAIVPTPNLRREFSVFDERGGSRKLNAFTSKTTMLTLDGAKGQGLKNSKYRLREKSIAFPAVSRGRDERSPH
ncbi:hypothetical protein CEXT_524101 [Caerostris extrusa]|uniref:Uncharacterized protein n=1 Tax=Caerostris extrusa TaxID=172846 RepID=A0AAV4WRA1_CAEEX|nr:hypothetical protein CEXT_524101 [Caerostris extrusa]